MSSRKNMLKHVVLSLIPFVSAIAWSMYYALDTASFVRLLKLVLPIYLGIFIVINLIFHYARFKPGTAFLFGFHIGLFLIAPFYMYQVSYYFYYQFIALPAFVAYPIKLAAGLVAAIASGTIVLILYNLLFKLRRKSISWRTAIMHPFILPICVILLLPLVAESQAAKPEALRQRTSYRQFVERQPVESPSHRVIVFGVDGADWDVIQPMLDDGKLPHFQKLMQSGRWGTLESMEPTQSPVVWTTIFTGKTPDEHGIDEWIVSRSENRLVKAVWNILSEYALRSTIINIPGTYPPEEFNGTEVSGFPFPNPTMNVYGWILSSENMKTNYATFSPMEVSVDSNGVMEGNLVVSDELSDRFNRRMASKNIRHLFLEHVIRNDIASIYGRRIKVARFRFEQTEGVLEILSEGDDPQTIAKLKENQWSDYFAVGLAPGVSGVTRINAVCLSNEKIILYMTPFFQPSDKPAFRYTYPESLAREITDNFGQYVVEAAWKGAKDHVAIPSVIDTLFSVEKHKSEIGQYLFNRNDWNLFIQVSCIADRTQHPTWFFHKEGIPSGMFDGLENKSRIESSVTGAIEQAYIRADEWLGWFDERRNPAKDVIMVISDHGFTAGSGRQAMDGVHRLQGIYIISGGLVNNLSNDDYRLNHSDTKSILDITPNILYLSGLPKADDITGETWLDLFDEDFTRENPVKSITTYNQEDSRNTSRTDIDYSAIEQLKGLGYIED